MNYPEDFKKAVLEIYPEDQQIKRLLEAGSTFLGRILDDSSSNCISLDTVLLASSLDELQQKAHEMEKRMWIYKRWSELYRKQNGLDDE